VPDFRRVAEAIFADRQGVPLAEWIASRRAEGRSWRHVARELAELTDGLVDVAPQTLINWTTAPEDGDAA
jgi:hypothetical protein